MGDDVRGSSVRQKHIVDAVSLFAKLHFLMKPRQFTPLLELPAPTLTMTHAQFGEGSFGTVMVAALGGTEVAAKHFRRQDAAAARQEARALLVCSHQNVVLNYGIHEFQDLPFPKPVSLTVSAL